MDTSIDSIVRDALVGRLLLTHPFYRRWEEGDLAPEELARYAEQYRHFESFLPEFLGQLAEVLDGKARDAVLDNLSDEVGEPSHLTLFEQFAAAYGADRVEASPAMSALLECYRTALHEGGATAMGALVAYEAQAAEIAQSKHDGLVTHYGGAAPAIDFWAVHGLLEQEHAKWTMDALSSMSPREEQIRRGVDLVADAWWRFLDERESLALV